MPSGVGLGIGLGIEQGARNFLDSFFAAKRAKHDEKYRKLSPIIQAIYSQIQDPNVPLDQRIKAIDTLPLILDPKYSGTKLSVQLGLDKLAEQEVDLGEQTIQGTKGGFVDDPNAIEANKRSLKVGDASNPDLLSTENVLATSINQAPTKTLKKRSLKRRGEMSANDLAIAKQVQINREEQENQFQRQYRLMQVQADLQSKTLAQQGWKNNDEWLYDENSKSWSQDWFNPITKETYKNTLPPGIVPQSVILKQIQAGGKGGDVSLAYKTLREAVATSMGKEVDDPEVNLATANMWRNNFALGVTNKVQNVTGTEPIQPNQRFNNNMQVLQAQQAHDRLTADAVASLNNVESLATRKGQAWQISADTKANFDRIKNDYDPEDKEFLDAQAAYNRALDDANRLESEYQAALRAHNSLTERVKSSEQNLSKMGISSSPSGGSGASQFSPQMRAAIAAVRKANPNTQLSDAQIAERIKADPKYSHIK